MLAALPVELFLQVIGSSLDYPGVAALVDSGAAMGARLPRLQTTRRGTAPTELQLRARR